MFVLSVMGTETVHSASNFGFVQLYLVMVELCQARLRFYSNLWSLLGLIIMGKVIGAPCIGLLQVNILHLTCPFWGFPMLSPVHGRVQTFLLSTR